MIKILDFVKDSKEEIFSRVCNKIDVSDAVEKIIRDVRENKDKALYAYTEKFDGVKLTELEVSKEEILQAINKVDKQFLRVLRGAARNIKYFHEKQKRDGFSLTNENGIVAGQKILPIEKVGIYVPGGTAAYPSTVLMDAIPAKIAGCEEVIMVTPPDKDGNVAPEILAAAAIAGVDKVFKIGGAQAVAALAYGTESVPAVYKIVGPGNAFVAEAKKQVFGKVAIDMIAGPSEILVIADEKASPVSVAADLLSQAEHDKNASAVLITDSRGLAVKVADEIEVQLKKLERENIARASIEDNGKIIIADSIEKAIEISNEIAPEHLELCLDDAMEHLNSVKNAGSVFLGRYCPEALGDYYAGPNHTLPTGGTAKFSSPLSVDDFVKKTQFIYASKQAFKNVSDDINTFAVKEGLTAHGKSATVRFIGEEK